MLFDKQFGFQLNNSREYATLQLVNDISSSFKKGKYTLGIFIELPTISKLLEDCYLCTSMGKLITKACWIILLYIYYFSNRNTELEQQSRAITREKPTPGMQKRTIRKLSKPFLYYNNSSATYRLILSGHIETNPGPANRDNQQTKPDSDRLLLSTCDLCNKTVQKLQDVDVYSLLKLGAFTMLHTESYPYHKKLS